MKSQHNEVVLLTRPATYQRPPLPLPPIEDEPDLGPMGGHDEVDAEIAGIANSYNSNSGVSASGAGQTDADGLTISHARYRKHLGSNQIMELLLNHSQLFTLCMDFLKIVE